MSRRIFGGSLLAGTGVLAVRRLRSTGFVPDRRSPQSRVAILHEDAYTGPAGPHTDRRHPFVRSESSRQDRFC
jgi:hypothetical protein